MMNSARRLAVALVALSAAAVPALADDEGPVMHTDQLVVVTPNAPVVISNGAPSQVAPAGPSAVAPATAATLPNGAPQNESWNDVNHINGTLVKVGEKGDYLLRYRKTNVSSNPIGWMFGFYGVSVSHAISPNIAVRLDANIFSAEDTHGYEVGASLPIYFRRVYQGPFIEPGLITRGIGNSNDSAASGCYDCGSSDYTMVGPEVLFGWHWSFDSGLNVAMAFGAARNMNNQMDYSSDVEPAGYFRIGYAF